MSEAPTTDTCEECGRDIEERCGFDLAWVGPCKNAKPCKKHKDKICASCSKPATRECEATGHFCCGTPLCGDCTHRTFPDGTNGGVGFNMQDLEEGQERHIPKAENDRLKESYAS